MAASMAIEGEVFSEKQLKNNEILKEFNKLTNKVFEATKNLDKKMLNGLQNIGIVTGTNFIISEMENKQPLSDTNLEILYTMLSAGGALLSENERILPDNLYREGEVDIVGSSVGKRVAAGLSSDKLNKHMKEFQRFYNQNTLFDPFQTGAIIHFLFVYIHPYFDMNGRTARILHDSYLYKHGLRNTTSLMNVVISMNKPDYYKAVQ